MTAKHHLITGAAGLIGLGLTEALLKEGNRVTALDNFTAGRRSALKETGAQIINGDVRDRQRLAQLVHRTDCVWHLASIVGVRKTIQRPVETVTVGLHGTENVLRAAAEHDKRVFLASSSAVYGKIETDPVHESADCRFGSPDNPSWTYSCTKLACEHLAFGYSRRYSTEVKIGRFFNVIGPNQHPDTQMVVPTFVSRALAGQPLQVYGGGTQTRTFVDVRDAVRGALLVCRGGESGKAYNIGGTGEISILSLARKIRSLTGSDSRVELVPYHQEYGKRFEETQQRRPDITRLRKLGFEPQFTLEETLGRIIEHLRQEEDC